MLYHHSIGFPNVDLPDGIFDLEVGKHAANAAYSDRYGRFEYPSYLDTDECTLIEIEVRAGDVVKLVYRQPYNDKYDLTMAVHLLSTTLMFVRTGWLNKLNDNHKTLLKYKYANVV